MSDGKTIIFGGGDSQNIASMLPALLQNRGIDPAYLMGLIGNNRGNGFFGGNGGFQDIIALIVIAAIFGNGNGNGIFGGGNNNNSAEREMIMQTLNRNGVDISQLAQALNCSTGQIIAAINQVAGDICKLGNQMGQNTNQIITAILQGNNALTAQIASCCCDLKQIMTQGFADLGYATRDQTCAIEKAIQASTAQILEGQRNAEMRELNRDIAERDRRIAEQATAINNYQQTQVFGQMLAPLNAAVGNLQSDIDGIKCKLPKTETIVATPDYVPINRGINVNYAPYNCGLGFGFGNWGGNWNGNGSLWG